MAATKEEEIFMEYYSKLIMIVDIDSLLPYFLQENIITMGDFEEIMTISRPKEKVQVLLQHISGPLQDGYVNTFHVMLNVMETHGIQATRELAGTMRSLVTTDIITTG